MRVIKGVVNMRKSISSVLVAAVVTTLFAFSAASADTELGIKSAILPGMGQISAGEGNITNMNTVKGLGFMAGFVLCLNGVIVEAGAMDSYAQQTIRLDKARSAATTHVEREEYAAKHEIAWDNYNDAKLMLIVFTSLTAVVYGYNIVDALLFTTPSGSEELSRSEKNVSVGLVYNTGTPVLKLNCRF
jgi:hypothetical protein